MKKLVNPTVAISKIENIKYILMPWHNLFSSRRLSLDQLTEEAEADLANNNDPNNNASSGNEGQDYPPHVPQQDNTGPEDLGAGESSRHSAASVNKYFLEDDGIDDFDQDPFQVAFESDINLILKLMPDRNYDEVRYLLESHQENPSRVQVSSFSAVCLLDQLFYLLLYRLFSTSFSNSPKRHQTE